MTLTLEQLKDAVSDLPIPERAELAQYLVSTLDDGFDPEIRAEWLEVATDRLKELKTKAVAGIPASEVLKNLLE
jgi:hypothetical protein